MDDAKEVKIPLVLLLAGLGIYVSYGFYAAGPEGAVAVLMAVCTQLGLGVLLGILACMLTAKLMDISFGTLSHASLKLAAIFAFPSAVSLYIPYFGFIVAFVLYIGLLAWLFELEGREVLVCAAVISVVRWLAGIMALAVLTSGK